eukprot:4992059-Pyramimonas_sp.AAC.1
MSTRDPRTGDGLPEIPRVQGGHADAVRTLLQLGADAEVPDAGGWLPLHAAAAANQVSSQPPTSNSLASRLITFQSSCTQCDSHCCIRAGAHTRALRPTLYFEYYEGHNINTPPPRFGLILEPAVHPRSAIRARD